MESKKAEKLTFKTASGSWRILLLCLALVLVFSFVAQIIVTQGFKVSVSEVTLEVRGGELNMEVYRPSVIEQGTKLPCMILVHGGSECLSTASIHAWEYAKRGIVVINLSMYGAGLSDMPEYMEDGADETNYSRNSGTHGVYDALMYARSISYVDTTRIGMWGHSQGYGITGPVAIFDGQLLTLNDRMLNVLYEEFGIEISEEDLIRNADEIAAEQLDAGQMELYNYCKEEQSAIVDNYVKAIRVMEMGNINIPTTVAGHEVTRSISSNLFIGGETRGGAVAPYNTPVNMMRNFHTDTPVESMSWYKVLSDYSATPDAKGECIGKVFEVGYTDEALKEAIDNNEAYFYFNPKMHHNGNLWYPKAIGMTMEFFTQCLSYNNGELSDPATKPISTNSIASSYIAMTFNTLALCALMAALAAVTSILCKTKFFAPCAAPVYESRLSVKSKNFAVAAILCTITAFFGAWVSSRENWGLKASNAIMGKFLPTEPGHLRLIFMIMGTAICGLVLFILLYAVNSKKKDESMPTIAMLNGKQSFANIMKMALLAIILFAICYLAAGFIKAMNCTRFLFIDGSLELMRPYAFVRMLKYTIVLLPFTLIISYLNNMTVLSDVSDTADTWINVLITSFGAILFVIVANIIVFAPVEQTMPGSIQANMGIQTLLPIITLVPLTNYLYRKLFKVTGGVWTGAIFVALFLGWRLAAFVSHRFTFWGYDSVISRFFGF